MRRHRTVLEVYVRRIRSQSFKRTAREIAHPGKIARHARRLLTGDIVGTNPYTPSFSRDGEVRFVASLIGRDEATVARAFAELDDDREFTGDMKLRYEDVRRGSTFHVGRFAMLYAIVRLLHPLNIVETGVHDGLSSAVMLKALERNGEGSLVSIDLPSTDLPPHASGPGWLVPDGLRGRWRVHLGDARDLLPQIAAKRAPVDFFFHDSDHSPDHQEFEFRTIRAHLSPSGVMTSDQDYPSETLLERLAAEWGLHHVRVRTSTGDPGNFIGGLAPPRPHGT